MSLRDIGPDLPWSELRDFIANLKPSGDSAFFRARYPKSWWWSPEVDFAAGILFSTQVANWQRGGGKGSKPKVAKKPKDRSLDARRSDPSSAADLAERKRLMEDELAARRARREKAVS